MMPEKQKEREQLISKLHESILGCSLKLERLLSDDFRYRKLTTENNKVKYMRPEENPPSDPDFRSSILQNTERNLQYLKSLFKHRILFLERLFSAKRDGFSAKSFHSKCDKKYPSLLLFQTKETREVFGAFTFLPWESPSTPKYRKDPRAFLFNFSKKTKHSVYQNEEYALLMDKNMGPCFGGGSDLRINDENRDHCSNLGFSYQYNLAGDYDTQETRMHLAGDLFFTLEDYELFYIELFHF